MDWTLDSAAERPELELMAATKAESAFWKADRSPSNAWIWLEPPFSFHDTTWSWQVGAPVAAVALAAPVAAAVFPGGELCAVATAMATMIPIPMAPPIITSRALRLPDRRGVRRVSLPSLSWRGSLSARLTAPRRNARPRLKPGRSPEREAFTADLDEIRSQVNAVASGVDALPQREAGQRAQIDAETRNEPGVRTQPEPGLERAWQPARIAPVTRKRRRRWTPSRKWGCDPGGRQPRGCGTRHRRPARSQAGAERPAAGGWRKNFVAALNSSVLWCVKAAEVQCAVPRGRPGKRGRLACSDRSRHCWCAER